jgi:hypothetical protein
VSRGERLEGALERIEKMNRHEPDLKPLILANWHEERKGWLHFFED